MYKRFKSISNIIRKFSNISTVSVSYTVYEEARTDRGPPPIFIMHGMLGSSANWSEASRRISATGNRRVYAIDARNHGKSPHTPEHSCDHMAADVVSLIKQLNFNKIVALGHSMGGYTAMTLAMNYPQLVDRVIIVDVSPIGLPKSMLASPSLFEFMGNIIERIPKDLTLGNGRRFATKMFEEEYEHSIDLQLIIRNLHKSSNGEFIWLVNVHALRHNWNLFEGYFDTISSLPPYEGPALLIAGSQSGFVKESHIPEIVQLFPNLEVKWLDAGHLVHFDQPNEFLNLVIDFARV